MNTSYSKIFLKFGVKEITIEGDENFVSKQFQQILGKEQSAKSPGLNSNKTQPAEKQPMKSTPSLDEISYKKFLNRLGTDFQNWLNRLSTYSSNRDKILTAAYYNQLMRSNQKFYIKDINTILKQYGIEIRRISNFIDTFEIQRFIYQIPESKAKGKAYKFTNEGIRYVNNLYASIVRTISVE